MFVYIFKTFYLKLNDNNQRRYGKIVRTRASIY